MLERNKYTKIYAWYDSLNCCLDAHKFHSFCRALHFPCKHCMYLQSRNKNCLREGRDQKTNHHLYTWNYHKSVNIYIKTKSCLSLSLNLSNFFNLIFIFRGKINPIPPPPFKLIYIWNYLQFHQQEIEWLLLLMPTEIKKMWTLLSGLLTMSFVLETLYFFLEFFAISGRGITLASL